MDSSTDIVESALSAEVEAGKLFRDRKPRERIGHFYRQKVKRIVQAYLDAVCAERTEDAPNPKNNVNANVKEEVHKLGVFNTALRKSGLMKPRE